MTIPVWLVVLLGVIAVAAIGAAVWFWLLLRNAFSILGTVLSPFANRFK